MTLPSTNSDTARDPDSRAALGDRGVVFNIMRYSTRDGPGLRTTVFLKGCPLHCTWCHNPESQSSNCEMIRRAGLCLGCGECVKACPNGVLMLSGGIPVPTGRPCAACGQCADVCAAEARERIGRDMTVPEVMAEILKDRAFFEETGGGVTFSGGEPLAQPEFLLELLKACRREELHTAVDTSGAASWEVIDRVREFVDLWLYDLKLMDDRDHQQHTGWSNQGILDNLIRLNGEGENVVIRVPVVPGLTDTDQNIDEIGAFVANLVGGVYIVLLPYHPTGMEKYRLLGRDYPLSGAESPTDGRLEEIAERLRRQGIRVGTMVAAPEVSNNE